MMTYRNAFVVAVKDGNNNVLRETSDKEVFLPFNSNYSLLLKNNNDRRAVAEITIDGTDILGGDNIIVPAHGSVDIDRFCLDGDLSNGNKLFFVKASDGRVQDPTSDENGKIVVRFFLEKEKKEEIHHHHHYHNRKPWEPYSPYDNPYRPLVWYSDSSDASVKFDTVRQVKGIRGSRLSDSVSCSGSFEAHNMDASYDVVNDYLSFCEDKGATVEGSASSQKFVHASVGDLEECCTELVLFMKPHKSSVTVKKTRKVNCKRCNKRINRSDRFCHSCGHPNSNAKTLKS